MYDFKCDNSMEESKNNLKEDEHMKIKAGWERYIMQDIGTLDDISSRWNALYDPSFLRDENFSKL